jgi:hypothetical protein
MKKKAVTIISSKFIRVLDYLFILFFILFPHNLIKSTVSPLIFDLEVKYFPNIVDFLIKISSFPLINFLFSFCHTFYNILYTVVMFLILIIILCISNKGTFIDDLIKGNTAFDKITKESLTTTSLRSIAIIKDILLISLSWDHGWYYFSTICFINFVLSFPFQKHFNSFVEKIKVLKGIEDTIDSI